jgi:hypothetical protein
MTAATTLAYPSIWMQKTFFHIVESERDHCIGERSEKTGQGNNLAIRVTALAHGILQLLYALVAVIPLTLVTLVTSQREADVTAAVAVNSLFAPAVNSFVAVGSPCNFDNRESEVVQEPIYWHAQLLATTLPPLNELANIISKETLTKLQEKAKQPNASNWQKFASRITTGAAFVATIAIQTDLTQNFLSSCDRSLQWRRAYVTEIMKNAQSSYEKYDEPFNLSSRKGAAILADSIVQAMG